MAGWTTEEISILERRAKMFTHINDMAAFLHVQTGLGWFVCLKWAEFLKAKDAGNDQK